MGAPGRQTADLQNGGGGEEGGRTDGRTSVCCAAGGGERHCVGRRWLCRHFSTVWAFCPRGWVELRGSLLGAALPSFPGLGWKRWCGSSCPRVLPSLAFRSRSERAVGFPCRPPSFCSASMTSCRDTKRRAKSTAKRRRPPRRPRSRGAVGLPSVGLSSVGLQFTPS